MTDKEARAFVEMLEAVGQAMLDGTLPGVEELMDKRDHRRLPYEHTGEGLGYTSLPPGFIPFKGGRPERDKPIGDGDIVDLKIALETSQTLERLFERV